MRILVTGANGYLGQGIVKKLLDNGNEVIATDFAIDDIDERACRVSANLFQINNPYEFFKKPNVVLHLAWRDGFKHYSIAHIQDLPLHYSFLSQMAGSVERIVVMGSMHEIGFWEGSINENTPTNPQSLYGISKNALRQGLEVLQKNIDFDLQWIRGFYIVGNTHAGCSIFSKIVTAEEAHEKLFPFTMGTNQYDFLDYEEFCNQVVAVVEQNKVLGIINCCSGYPESLGNRVERFLKENKYSIKLQYGAFSDRPYDSKAIWGNDEKIKKIISMRYSGEK